MIAEGVQPLGPEDSEGFQPGVERGQLGRLKPVQPSLAVGPHADQAGLAQQLQVFRNAGLAEAGRLDQLAGRAFSSAQQVEDLATRGFGDGFKRAHANI